MLIFYMVTAVFMMPQAMEVNNPEETKDPPIVPWSKLLTIRIDSMNRFYWNIGDPAEKLPQLVPSVGMGDEYVVAADSLRTVLWNLHRIQPKLCTVVRIHPMARFNAMVDMLDEIISMEYRWNDRKAHSLGKSPEQLIGEERFSYRYSTDKWVDVDDRIVAEALAAAGEGR